MKIRKLIKKALSPIPGPWLEIYLAIYSTLRKAIIKAPMLFILFITKTLSLVTRKSERECLLKCSHLLSSNFVCLKGLAKFALQKNYSNEAEKIFEMALTLQPNNFGILTNLGRIQKNNREFEKAYDYYKKALTIKNDDDRALFNTAMVAKHLRKLKEAETYFAKGLRILKALPEDSLNTSTKRRLEESKKIFDQVKFINDTQGILEQIPQPKNPRGVVCVASYKCFPTLAMSTIVLCRLRQEGYATVFLSEETVVAEPTGHDTIDQFQSIILTSRMHITGDDTSIKKLRYEWVIDWENKRVEANGINFYQPIFERISKTYLKYNIDIKDHEIAAYFDTILLQVDTALSVCEKIYAELAQKGLPVRILTSNSQYSPYGVFRVFCDQIGRNANMHFMSIVAAYQHYYTGLKKAKCSTAISLEDVTYFDKLRTPFLARREQFDEWLKQSHLDSETIDEANKWVNANRTDTKKMSKEAQDVYETLLAYKKDGKKIACIFGKIVYDLALPYDGGPAHSDMKDWINHTIECAKESDAIFLVKPHPHEIRKEIAGKPKEYFLELVETDIPENVIILEHTWFNMKDLYPLLDLGILWNGTTGLELGVNGIPAIMCSYWGIYDYPVDYFASKDRADYQHMLSNIKKIKAPKDHSQRCAALLSFLKTEEIMIPYEYSRRPGTNEDTRVPKWYMDKVEDFFQNGDPHIDRLVERFFRDSQIIEKKAANT